MLDPDITRWWSRDHWTAAARFAVERVDAFYREVARVQGKSGATHFVEKARPDSTGARAATETWAGGKEIMLVRDFRDVVCSMLAFNARRGFHAFRQKAGEPAEQFIRGKSDMALRVLASWRERKATAHLLRYEDLILQPERTLRAALAYAGLDAGDGVIAGMLARARALTPEQQRYHITSGDPAASIGRWRRDFDDRHQAACRETFDDLLQELGYELE
jgi:hypothetical protein